MNTHWEQSVDWDAVSEDTYEGLERKRDPLPSGSYHCKSALRDHNSNMKLFLYKQSYLRLSNIVGALPYTDESLLLLPDFWNCFYYVSHGLNRIEDVACARDHSTGSPSFLRWADYTMSPLLVEDDFFTVLKGESHIWGMPDSFSPRVFKGIYLPIMAKVRRCLYLLQLVNLTLVVLNYKPSPDRADVDVELPGICRLVEEHVYRVTFNEYLYFLVTDNAVFVHTPIFAQILQKDLFLNLCDKISERVNIVIGCATISGLTRIRFPSVDDHPDRPLPDHIDKIIKWGDDLLYRHRNAAYELIGTYEAICVSSILVHDDPLIWNNMEFQTNLLEDIMKNNPRLHEGAIHLTKILNGLDPAVLSEVHGLWRVWGHPIIDLEGGLKKMEATCLKQVDVDIKETATGVRTFKFILFTNYYNKHHHYPLSNITAEDLYELYTEYLTEEDKAEYHMKKSLFQESSYLLACIRQNKPIKERESRYSHKDWDLVSPLRSFQIPQSINLATMIKDKAISQTRSELIASVILKNSVFDPTKRRGVLKWLSEQTLKLASFLYSIDKTGLDEDDRIIGLYPKERELKTKARFFSLMSYKMRMYITATEEILGKYMLPYFPMITMSDTLLNMIIRLYNMTTKIGSSGSCVTYSMNIDFSKWNQNMRESTNDGIFKAIDRVLGFSRLISRTHETFRGSYLYLCSGEYLPRIMRGQLTATSPYSRIGDESGKEGLRQKGWTITTVCDIVSLAFAHGVRIELIGGGDNQVLTVTVRTSAKDSILEPSAQLHKAKETMSRFRNALAKKMDKRGLPLKLEETWISHRLLMYNKIMYLDGVPLPGRLKVISRMFGNSNEGISCLGSIMSTLGTGYQSLSAKDYDPILAWVISRWLTLITLSQWYLCNPMTGTSRLDKAMISAYKRKREGRNLFGPDFEGLEVHSLVKRKAMETACKDRTLTLRSMYYICLYYHKVLGGPGIGSPLSYIMKGFPDPLSEGLSFNYSVINSLIKQQERSHEMVSNLTAVNKSPIFHWEHLLEDPVSINHDAPSHGVAALRNQASNVMKQAEIQNKAFKELISIGDTEYLRDLAAKLCSPKKIEPRLLHDIIGSTIPGYVNTILSKVDQSATLNKIASNFDVISQIYTSEMLYYMFLADKIQIERGHKRGPCPTEDARGLRNHTWGKEIIGVTTPHPMSYLRAEDHSSVSAHCDHSYISVLTKRDTPLHIIKRGPFRPYFGSYTAEKFKSSILASAYGDEDLLKRSLKIQKLLGWRYKEGTNMYKLIQGILSCVTDADPAKFLPTVQEITGDVEHRYHDMATKHGGIPTNLVRDLTYTTCNTTTFINHSKGSANETIHFQAAIIYSSVMSSLKVAHMPQVTKVLHFHESCSKCIVPIDNTGDDGQGLSDIALGSCPQNPLMFIKEQDIPVHFHNVVAFHQSQRKEKAEAQRAGKDLRTIEFNEPIHRNSWMLLAITSCILGNLKQSAIKLLLDRMSIHETVDLVRAMLHYTLLNRDRPLLGFTLCDIKDMTDEYKDLISKILDSRKVMEYLLAKGSNVVEDVDVYERLIQIMLETSGREYCNPVAGAVCKYQDPEYKVSRLIYASYAIPSLKTCQLCVQYWRAWSKNQTAEACGIHKQSDLEMRYHLYSLDKLWRYAGEPVDRGYGVVSKKRKIGLFKSVITYRAEENGRKARARLSQFLHSKLPIEDNFFAVFYTGWNISSIMGTNPDDMYTMTFTRRQLIAPDDVTRMPMIMEKTLLLAHSIFGVIKRVGRSRTEVNIGIDIPPGIRNYVLYRKALSIVISMYKKSKKPTKCGIHLLLSDVKNLEDVALHYLQNLEYELKSFSSSQEVSTFCVTYAGDASLDIFSAYQNLDAIISCNERVLGYLGPMSKCPFFFLSDSENCSLHVDGLNQVIISDKLRSDHSIILPSESFSWPFPIILEITKGNTYNLISHDGVVGHIQNSTPRFDPIYGMNLTSSISHDALGSIVWDTFKECVPNHAGIYSEEMYNSIRSKLSAGLSLYVLKHDRSQPLSWKCCMLLKLIICLDIKTAYSPTDLLSAYGQVVGTSFSPVSYRKIQLYIKRENNKLPARMINWTAGTIGEEILRTYPIFESMIHCTWKTERKFLRWILI